MRDMLHRLATPLLLVAAVMLAYLPALGNGFVWDDDLYLTRNPLVTAPDGLWRIWFSRDAPSQYFPLVLTSFRLEHALWGLRPFGYHLVNVLLHAANTLLLWRILRRLGLPSAWLAAGLFALHPVQVESVAWVTERKNVLSAFFSLLAFAGWLGHLEAAPGTGRGRYLAAFGSYLLALFAKTTAATLTVPMLLVPWLRGERPGRRQLCGVAPFAAAGFVMGLVSLWWEHTHQGTRGPWFEFPFVDRVLIAGRAFWFSLSKLAWPQELLFIYPRWRIDRASPAGWVAVAAAIAALWLLWRHRGRFGRGPAPALALYLATLSPTLGFFALYTFRYAFAADHYQYLACIAPFTAAACAAAAAGPTAARRRAGLAAGAAVLLLLGALTWRQCRIYRDEETLWRDTLEGNPGAAIAAGNLGMVRMRAGDLDAAIALYGRALATDPGLYEAHANWAVALTRLGRAAEAVEHYRAALGIFNDNIGVHVNLAVLLAQAGLAAEAETHLREALRIGPGEALPRHLLAGLLFSRGSAAEAEALEREALRLQPEYADAHYALATMLAARGRDEEAQAHFAAAFARLQNGQRRPGTGGAESAPGR